MSNRRTLARARIYLYSLSCEKSYRLSEAEEAILSSLLADIALKPEATVAAGLIKLCSDPTYHNNRNWSVWRGFLILLPKLLKENL